MSKRMLLVGLVVLVFLLAACQPASESGEPQTSPTEAPQGKIAPGQEYSGVGWLIEALNTAGATVEEGGSIQQDFFSVPGESILVNGENVQVFTYESESLRESDSALISADGSIIGNTIVSWVDQPHFWAVGKMIVLYVGSDEVVTGMLTQVLGQPQVG